MKDLNEFSDYYSYIALGKPSGSFKVDQKLEDIRTIAVTIVYSFLLDLLHKWKSDQLNDQELIYILEALNVYFIRRRILKLTQGENKNFPPLVKQTKNIINSSNKNQKMFEILADQDNSARLPNDYEMIDELKGMNFYNNRHAKFILSLVEEKITKNRPDKNDKMLQIEHIMPQTLTPMWEKELGEEFEAVHLEYLNNIGNLTLIRHNQELGNKPFLEKKKIYNDSAGLQIARNNIIDYSIWNKDSILQRRKWLIDFILKEILVVPEEMRYKNNYLEKRSRVLSFVDLELIGEEINYISDKSIVVKVVTDREVTYEGKRWHLSPLTREIETMKGTVNQSGSYQGAQYWEFEGIKLADII